MDGDAIRARDRLFLAGIGAATLPAAFDSTLDEIGGRFLHFAVAAVLTTAGDSFGEC